MLRLALRPAPRLLPPAPRLLLPPPAPPRLPPASRLLLARPLSSSAAGLDRPMQPAAAAAAKRSKRSVAGVLSIRNTWNNTLVTITDTEYKVKGWTSCGTAGFKKSKRSSVFAMEKCLGDAFQKARSVRAAPAPRARTQRSTSHSADPARPAPPHHPAATHTHTHPRPARVCRLPPAAHRRGAGSCDACPAPQLGMQKVMINMTGPAVILRKPLLRSLREQSSLRIMKLRLADSVPHGGCRPRKARRRRYKTKAKR